MEVQPDRSLAGLHCWLAFQHRQGARYLLNRPPHSQLMRIRADTESAQARQHATMSLPVR